MSVTLKDIAREANVSYQTVWRALHDSNQILPSTRDRIRVLADRLGYRPNRVAGSLRTKRSATIGLVVIDLGNSYTAQVVSGVEARAARRGYSVLVMSSKNDFERERKAVHSLMERAVDGLIMSSADSGDHGYLKSELRNIPLVAVNHPIPKVKSITVSAENRKAGFVAGQYLVKQEHKRIAGLFGGFQNLSNYERHEGFVRSLRRAEIAVHKKWLCSGNNSVEFAREAIPSIFSERNPPTALFASTQLLTEGALLGLRDIGLRHGFGVTVVGFDVRFAPVLEPPLPVFLQPAVEIGEAAADALIDIIAGSPVHVPKKLPIAFRPRPA